MKPSIKIQFFPLSRILLGIFFLAAAKARAVSSVPESARPYGLGNAFCAIANDYNAVIFNPAGLDNLEHVELSGNAGRYIASANTPQNEIHIGGALPLRYYNESWKGGAGFLLHRSGQTGNGAVTNLGVSWGGKLTWVMPRRLVSVSVPDQLLTGMSFRIREVQHSGAANRASSLGLSLDMGWMYQFYDKAKTNRGWTVAMTIQEMNSSSVSGPVLMRLGVAWKNPYSLLALDIGVQDGVSRLYPGVELSFFRRLFLLRFGSGEIDGQPRQLVAGIGTVLPPIQLDFAYGVNTSDASKSNDRILVSFIYRFDAPFLSQYIYNERLERITELEQMVNNLEAKKETLAAAVKDYKELYKNMENDMDREDARTKELRQRLKVFEDEIAAKNKEKNALEKEIETLRKIKRDRSSQEIKPTFAVREPGSPGGSHKHKVKIGDSLRGLAEQYYGDPNKWQVIYDANENKVIRGVPKEGEVLTIP